MLNQYHIIYHFCYINRVVFSWFLLIVGTQMIICKLFFVSNDSANLKTIIIDNRLVIYCNYFIEITILFYYRRAFNMFSYIVLLYNMATGLMIAIIRVGLSFLFMIVILPRMDRLMYLRGFEKFDLSNNFIRLTSVHNVCTTTLSF